MQAIIDDILRELTRGRKTKGGSTQFNKKGGWEQAQKDFDNLRPSKVKSLPVGAGGGRTGVLPDGRKVTACPTSSDSRPTLEIQKGKRRQKIRYDE